MSFFIAKVNADGTLAAQNSSKGESAHERSLAARYPVARSPAESSPDARLTLAIKNDICIHF